MTYDDRAQAAAAITLLSALLGTLWALQHGLGPQATGLTTALAYGGALVLSGLLQAPLGASIATSLKYLLLGAAFILWVTLAVGRAGWQTLRGGRAEKEVFA
ncbi:hypothetical protein [Streptomyces sp. PsTaAH-124]|uniref:hypothetical protein n=1 Tax=Streptomyces sp. PsTaAH-124 TaxID=1157638 RepID=UPI0003655604|nr:hypothetical protein [Streptomyces sp. PsTaAH-124]